MTQNDKATDGHQVELAGGLTPASGVEIEIPADQLATKSQKRSTSDETDQKGHSDSKPAEIGGPKGPEPTRYGDWEKNGRCYDF